MRLQAVVVVVLLAIAGCGGGDDQLDREQLVPKGMRRTTVTAHDVTTETAAGTRTAPAAPAPETPVDETETTGPAPAADLAATGAAMAEAPVPETPVAETPAEAAVPAAPEGGLVVQAGAFRQPATAEGVAGKLRGLGLDVRIETAQVGGGTFHRVVVPGLPDRAAAAALVARLKQELGIDAVVRTP